MPWFKVDDNLAFHHKVVAAGNPAMGLWVRAGSLCAQQLTDGFIPDHMIAAMGTVAQAKRLVQVGLWDRARGGYKFHGWDERQPSKASVEAERAAAQDRMRAHRAKKKGSAPKPNPQVSDVSSEDVQANEHGTNGEVQRSFGNPDPVPVPSLSHPDPSSASGKPQRAELVVVGKVVEPAAEPSAQTLVAEWLDHCRERPPASVIGQVSKQLKAMLGEGIAPDRLLLALAEWNGKGLHPSTLPSVVHEIANRRPKTSSRGPDLDAAMQRARAKEAQMRGEGA